MGSGTMKRRNPIAKAVRKIRPMVVPDKRVTYRAFEYAKEAAEAKHTILRETIKMMAEKEKDV